MSGIKTTSGSFKEAWFNPNSNGANLIIIDRITGKIQEFTLDKEYSEPRYKYKPTQEELASQPEGYQTPTDPDQVYGANGWKRMRRLELTE